MKGLVRTFLLTAVAAFGSAQVHAQDTGAAAQPSERREAQRQSESERKEQERARREEAQRQPGVRCARYKRKG